MAATALIARSWGAGQARQAEVIHWTSITLALALAVALVQSIVPLVGAGRGWSDWMRMAVPTALVQFALIGFSFCALVYAFVTLDFSVRLVATHANSMMPDLFNYLFTGEKVSEFTDATTTQFYDPREGGWSIPLLEKMGIPTRILPEVIPPGTVLGPLEASVAEDAGLGDVPVIARSVLGPPARTASAAQLRAIERYLARGGAAELSARQQSSFPWSMPSRCMRVA